MKLWTLPLDAKVQAKAFQVCLEEHNHSLVLSLWYNQIRLTRLDFPPLFSLVVEYIKELAHVEKEKKIRPSPDIDAFMKVVIT